MDFFYNLFCKSVPGFLIDCEFIFVSDSIEIFCTFALHLLTEVDYNCIATLNFWSEDCL
jgi:hypothetical protein